MPGICNSLEYNGFIWIIYWRARNIPGHPSIHRDRVCTSFVRRCSTQPHVFHLGIKSDVGSTIWWVTHERRAKAPETQGRNRAFKGECPTPRVSWQYPSTLSIAPPTCEEGGSHRAAMILKGWEEAGKEGMMGQRPTRGRVQTRSRKYNLETVPLLCVSLVHRTLHSVSKQIQRDTQLQYQILAGIPLLFYNYCQILSTVSHY